MAQIEMRLDKQMLTILNQEVVSSGDVDYDACSFDFDASWDGFTKTGVFYQDKKDVQYAVLGADGRCTIPAQAMAREGNMYIGVFGINGTMVMTSTVERVFIRQGAISGDTVSKEPNDDIFLAIISQYQRVSEMMQGYNATAAELSKMLHNLNAYDVADVLTKLGETEASIRSIELASGGLRFGMDTDGNWGYIVPESEEVIAFGSSKADTPEEALKTYMWQAVECSDEFEAGEREWYVDASRGTSPRKKLFLAVRVPNACKTIVHVKTGTSCEFYMYLNDELIMESGEEWQGDAHAILPLGKGNNYIFLECWSTGTTNNNTLQISFAPIVA